MTPELKQTLVLVAAAAAEAAQPWWVIGSAAVAIHGVELPDVRDVDLLMSTADARRFLVRVGAEVGAEAPDPQFRSAVHGIWHEPPLCVDVMGDFSFLSAAGWLALVPQTRQRVAIDGHELFVPSAAELRDILHSFGREKDLERARRLPGAQSLSAASSGA